MSEEREYIDVEITEEQTSATHERQIRGTVLYFSTSQVAARLGMPDSKVRYYTKFFDELLHVEYVNKQRRYTDEDVKRLQFLAELKEEGMTLQQILNYCENVDFDNPNGIQIKQDNPLSIQALSKALLEEQSRLFEEQFKRIENMKEDLLKMVYVQVNNQLEQMQLANEQMRDQIIENVSTTVDEIVTEKLQVQQDKLVEELKKRMEQNRLDFQSQQQEKKGWLSRIFG